MARTRALKPDFWDDETLGQLGPRCRLLFAALICHADDEGRLRGHPSRVKSEAFPYDDDVRGSDVQNWLDELQSAGRIEQYGSPDGTQRYIWVKNFSKHQSIKHFKPSDLPAPHSKLPIREVAPAENLETTQFAGDSPHTGDTGGSDVSLYRVEMSRDETNTSSSENDLDLGADKEPNPVEGEVTQVLHHWKQTYDKPKSAITGPKAKSRRSRVRSRLSEGWTVDELKKALDGHWTRDIIKSNPQYHRIETVLRDSTQVEAGIDQLSSSVPQSYEWRDPFPENDPFGEEPRLG